MNSERAQHTLLTATKNSHVYAPSQIGCWVIFRFKKKLCIYRMFACACFFPFPHQKSSRLLLHNTLISCMDSNAQYNLIYEFMKWYIYLNFRTVHLFLCILIDFFNNHLIAKLIILFANRSPLHKNICKSFWSGNTMLINSDSQKKKNHLISQIIFC